MLEIGCLQDSIDQMQSENETIGSQLRLAEREKMETKDELETAEIKIRDLKNKVQNEDSEVSNGEKKYQKLKVNIEKKNNRKFRLIGTKNYRRFENRIF